MKTMIRTVLAGAAALVALHAVAGPAGTDDARALAAAKTAAQADARAFELPTLEPVAPGDYRAAATNETRLMRFVEMQREVQAHMSGVRSAAIHVDSQDSAYAEASRRQHEAELDRLATFLSDAPSAMLIHREATIELGAVAMR